MKMIIWTSSNRVALDWLPSLHYTWNDSWVDSYPTAFAVKGVLLFSQFLFCSADTVELHRRHFWSMDPKQGVPPPYPGEERNIHFIQSPIILAGASVFGPDPVQIECRYCNETMVTRVKPIAGNMTWIFCGALAIFGCWLGCCLIPFCVRDLQDMEHKCSACGSILGIYRRKL
jgi:lipopolysaccharide-induced tumor necrosis factor-alpha factor